MKIPTGFVCEHGVCGGTWFDIDQEGDVICGLCGRWQPSLSPKREALPLPNRRAGHGVAR